MQEENIIRLAAKFENYHPEITLGIEDDAALFLPEPEFAYAWCVDTLVENTHFLRQMPAKAIGWKALAVNLSDLAAMNAQPVACLLSLGIPSQLSDLWVLDFFEGLKMCCDRYRVNLAGGDTVKQTSEINISISVLGKTKQAFRRKGAQVGDALVVTGKTHGASAAGLAEFFKKEVDQESLSLAQHTHLYPEPQFEAAHYLSKLSRAHVLDTSDSLLKSARLLAEINQQGCKLESALIPGYVSFEHEKYVEWVLQGGEDFELMAAVPSEQVKHLPATLFTRIGQLTANSQKYTLHTPEKEMVFSDVGEGYYHFR